MTTTPQLKHLRRWEYPKNYAGPDWSDYYAIEGRHRDSETLDNSNWECWKEFLKDAGDVKNPDYDPAEAARIRAQSYILGSDHRRLEVIEDEFIPAVIDIRASHWAVGWVETLLVHKDAPPELLQKIDEKLDDLARYPVFDDQHFSDLEQKERDRCWDEFAKREWYKWFEEQIGEEAVAELAVHHGANLECLLYRAYEHTCMGSGSQGDSPMRDYTIEWAVQDSEMSYWPEAKSFLAALRAAGGTE